MFSFLKPKPKHVEPCVKTERFSLPYEGGSLCVVLRRRRQARRLTMRFHATDASDASDAQSGAEIRITAPLHVDKSRASAFVAENMGWVRGQIAKNRAIISQHCDGRPAVWYLGRLTPVLLRQASRRKIVAEAGRIIISMPESDRLQPHQLLEAWLKTQARAKIAEALDAVLAEGLPQISPKRAASRPVSLSIRDQKTRWGSCSTSGRLSFNWRLIMAPEASLYYVVVHEAVHLLHHDHSPRFWGGVAEVMPDYKQHQDWLKRHQGDLFASLKQRLAAL